jgi:hypothetical protein
LHDIAAADDILETHLLLDPCTVIEIDLLKEGTRQPS